MNANYFEVTYRGLTAEVEPANGEGRWEYRLTTDGDWHPLDIGNFPAVKMDAARAAAVARLKARHPDELAAAYIRLERARAEVTALTVDSEGGLFNPVLHTTNIKH